MIRYRAIATATLLGGLLAACDKRPPAAEQAAAGATTANTNAAANAETLRQRADRAMREQRLFAPAGDNALEHYLALQRQDPADAGVRAGLVDLQPLLVIAIEQAIARGELPEGQRLVRLLRVVDAKAPALGRLQATLSDAEGLVLARAQATDPAALAKAEADAAALRQQAEANAARLATARTTATPPPAASIATAPAPVAAAPAVEPAPPRPAATVPARQEPVAATPPQRPASEPARATAGQPPRLLRQVAPVYPASAQTRRLSGQVQVAFTIGEDGNVEDPRVVATTLPNAFARAALTAVTRWKFEASGSRHQSERTLVFAPTDS